MTATITPPAPEWLEEIMENGVPAEPAPPKSQTDGERIKADTLAWLQEKNPGLKAIPQGRRHTPGSCPLARGIGGGARVGGNYYRPSFLRGERIKLPKQVRRFRAWFDAGRFPELVE